jgi:hypothetical protein
MLSREKKCVSDAMFEDAELGQSKFSGGASISTFDVRCQDTIHTLMLMSI